MRIVPFARADLPAVTDLFRAYADSLPIDLGYQGFDGELATLPGKYAPPDGALLIARDANGAALGCVALRALHPSPQGEGVVVARSDAMCGWGGGANVCKHSAAFPPVAKQAWRHPPFQGGIGRRVRNETPLRGAGGQGRWPWP